MITVRSIIVEALNRSNIVSRRQSAPADMVETAYRLLKGIASKFSDDNLLQFLVSDVTAVLDRQEFVLGETDEDVEEYLDVDVPAVGIQCINRVYWTDTDGSSLGTCIELSYASPSDFDGYPNGAGVYTWQPVNDLQVVLKTKLVPDPRLRLKISYNRKWDFDLDSELRIPDKYAELFIAALTHKLAMTFPRLSTEQVKLLKDDLDEMVNSVKVSTRAIKYVGRKQSVPAVDRMAFLNGTMFLH